MKTQIIHIPYIPDKNEILMLEKKCIHFTEKNKTSFFTIPKNYKYSSEWVDNITDCRRHSIFDHHNKLILVVDEIREYNDLYVNHKIYVN